MSYDRKRELCNLASGITNLARTQMITSNDTEWRRLSRKTLAVEGFTMGVTSLEPTTCYVIARGGESANEPGAVQRRAFEVRDFARSAERTPIMVIGPGT
jgi:hypothetical protein